MEKEIINVAEILRNCQSGMELDCVCFENVVFDRVDYKNRIRCFVGSQRDEVSFNEYGCLNGSPSAKCVIFPKGKTSWEGFVSPCKYEDGDVLAYNPCQNKISIYIYRKHSALNTSYYVALSGLNGFMINNNDFGALNAFNKTVRFATEEEKQRLFDAIKKNGYRWNPETKTLEELPKFKVGDWVVNIDEKVNQVVAIDDNCDGFTLDDGSHSNGAWNKLYRLWTIQDAKEGDVLADGNLPFILKKIDANNYSYAYCGISVDDGFKIKSEGKSGEWTWMQDIKPATKEQRDFLFQKMEESGYEWDAEKKELKKLIVPKWNKDMNEVSVIINGVRYDAEPALFNSCKECDLTDCCEKVEMVFFTCSALIGMYRCFKKSTKSFEK